MYKNLNLLYLNYVFPFILSFCLSLCDNLFYKTISVILIFTCVKYYKPID